MAPAEIRDRFAVRLDVIVRPCVQADLPGLEWFGLFTPHREIIRSAFREQERGDGAMLVAEANGFPLGQAWIDFRRKHAESCAVLWAVRVFPAFRRLGIGARIMTAAERAIRERGLLQAELGVERTNPDALRFYGRLGYRQVGTERGSYGYTPPGGARVCMPLDQWLLRKPLDPP